MRRRPGKIGSGRRFHWCCITAAPHYRTGQLPDAPNSVRISLTLIFPRCEVKCEVVANGAAQPSKMSPSLDWPVCGT